LRRYFERLSPIADIRVEDRSRLCGVDLGRVTGVFPEARFRYRAAAYAGPRATRLAAPLHTIATDSGKVCVELPRIAPEGGPADSDLSRYLVVDVSNGQALAPLRAHLYDLGSSRGFQLAGVERPENDSAPEL